MSIQSIYSQLVRAGLSPAGACGLMGNMHAESAMRSDNVQDGMGYNDADYTAAVDAGLIDFVADGRGYGLCQWTYGARKRNLLDFARSRGVSVGDETMQVDFCIHELRNEYPALWLYLCSTKGVYDAARRVCIEYERPAVNNVDVRAAAANEYFMRLGGMDVGTVDNSAGQVVEPAQGSQTPQAAEYWPPRALEFGMYGPDVVALQGLLVAHGYNIAVDGHFGNKTKTAAAAFQAERFSYGDGKVDAKTWAALTERG